MSELRFGTFTMPAATLGPENPLPHLLSQQDLHAQVPIDASLPEEIRRNLEYGRVQGCLPYGLQDSYDRNRKPRAFRVAMLENDVLRATFLLELGGRLWSLIHKPSGRELLCVNPVFQPANLAIRNAWFSGGVEWNIGMIGHTPLTCSPMFAARTRLDDGTPVLRMYEWERIRQVPYQIDAWLPDGSAFLFVRVRIRNPHDRESPMYWWSNMAAPEAPGTRVLAPAESAYRFDYKTGMKEIPIPFQLNTDISYPATIDRCVDFYFRVADRHRPWIASLDPEGKGLIQTSTARLRGRKLFVWGTSPGGRRWQEFLSVPGHPYVEIQAGLARTQSECLPMPAGAEWAWLEAYGLMEADASVVHGAHWTSAWQEVGRHLDGILPIGTLDAEFERGATMAARRPEEMAHHGSGWGALERHRRDRMDEPPLGDEALQFDDAALGEAQMPWRKLLEEGAFPYRAPSEPPGAWMVQTEWRALLEKAVEDGKGNHWLAWLHLGVMRHHAGDPRGAREAWERSLNLDRSAWALRNLAVLARQEKRLEEAADLWLQAHRLAPDQFQLAVECGRVLIEANQTDQCFAMIDALPPQLRNSGRIRSIEARARLTCGEFDEAEKILLDDLVLVDLQESESSLMDLWFDLQERRLSAREKIPVDEALRERVRRQFPLPRHLNFRGQEI